jgi:DNA polymerase-3 subunit beta
MTATATRRRKGVTTFNRAEFAAAWDAASWVVPTRSPNPALCNVLLEDGMMTGTDMDVQVAVPIDWHDEPILIPEDRMSRILKATKGEEIGLRVDGTSLIVTAVDDSRSSGLWRLPIQSAQEYPRWSPSQPETLVRVAAENVSRSIRAVHRCVDNSGARYAMGGILIDVRDGVATFVATDGRRMYWSSMDWIEQAVEDRETLVPLLGMLAIERVAASPSHAEDAVQFDRTKTELIANVGGTIVTSRLLQGQFPRWRDLLREDLLNSQPAKAKRVHLESAFRSAAIVSTDESKGVVFLLSEAALSLSGKSADYGESAVTMDLDAGGFTAAAMLDPRFVLDWLSGLSSAMSPEVEIRGTDGNSAVMLSCEKCHAIVMPLTTEG